MKQNISNCYRCHAVSKLVLTAKIIAANIKLTNLILEQEDLLSVVALFCSGRDSLTMTLYGV